MTRGSAGTSDKDPALEEEFSAPPGYDIFLARVRVRARSVAESRGLTAFATLSEYACYAEFYEQLFRHDYASYVLALEEIYANQEIPSPGIGDLFRIVHELPTWPELSREAVLAAAGTAFGSALDSAEPLPLESIDRERGFLETAPLLAEAFAIADAAGRGALLLHLSDFLVNIATPRLADIVSRTGVSEADPKTALQFVRLLNQLKRIVRLGTADRVLSDRGGAGNGVVLLQLLGTGLAPVSHTDRGVSLVSVS